MTILTWVWAEDANGIVSPEAIYYALRVVMFILSFVLEDWAIYELVRSPKHRSEAVALVASSYVTWTFQTHTFSNSIETLLVAWSLVLIDRILHEKVIGSLGSMDVPADKNPATFTHCVVYHPLFSCRPRRFQPRHFSSLHLDTRHAPAATFFG